MCVPTQSHPQDHSSCTTEIETLGQNAIRKATWRLVPLLAVAYLFNYIDRTNVGFAALTMNRDLGLTATQFGFGVGVFHIGYCIFEVPSNLALYRFGARRWLARIMISWGLAATAMALTAGPRSYAFLRFLVGTAEAGFFPGVIFYLSAWFPVQYRARVMAWFLMAVPVSAVIGGPLSTTILQMNGFLHLTGWRWLFLLQGMPAVVCGVITLAVLVDSPREASWLTPQESDALITMLGEEKREREKHALLPALKDARVIIMTAMVFFWVFAIIGIGIWMPLILKSHGHLSNIQVGYLVSIPYLIGSVAIIPWARQVDRTRKYINNFALAATLAAGGCILSVLFASLLPALLGMTAAIIGISSMRPPFYAMPARFLTGAAAAGGLGFINGIGNLGGLVGPWVMGWLKDATGFFAAGMYAMAGALLITVFLTLSLKFVVKEE